MKRNLLIWFPQVLGILFAVFLALFAFDTSIFSLGFLIHLVPALVVGICVFISWKNRRIGGILFLTLFLIFTIFFHQIILFLLLFIIGVLLLIPSQKNNKNKKYENF